jgi:hypothetical protein
MNTLATFLTHPSTKKVRDSDSDSDSDFAYYTCIKDTISEKPVYTYHCIRGIYESDLTPSYTPNVIHINKGIQTIFEQALFHTLFPRHRLYYRNPFTDKIV